MEKIIELLKRVNLNGTIDDIVLEVGGDGVSVKAKDRFGMVAIFAKTDDKTLTQSIGLQNVTSLLKIIGGNTFEGFELIENSVVFKNKRSKLEWKLGEISVLESISKSKDELTSLYSKDKINFKLDVEVLENFKKTISSIDFCDKIKFSNKGNNLVIEGEDDVYHNVYESVLKEGQSKKCNNLYKREYFNKILNAIDFEAEMEFDFVDENPFPLHIFGKTKVGIEIDYFIVPMQN